MAFFAGLAETFHVRIILVVAVIASRRCIAMFLVLLMAAGACQTKMRAYQWKVRLTVIKGIRIEMDDVGVTPYMVGMAGLARQLFDIFNSAMESLLFLDISRDLLVTIEAKMFLGVLAERFMAFFALSLIFGVGFDYLARHDQGFKIGCASR